MAEKGRSSPTDPEEDPASAAEWAEGGLVRKPISIPRKTRPTRLVRREVAVRDEAPKWDEAHEARDDSHESEKVEIRARPMVPEDHKMSFRAPAPGAAGRGETPASAPPPEERRRRQRGEPEGEDAWTGTQNMSLWWVLAGLGCVAVLAYFMAGAMKKAKAGALLAEPKRTEMKDNIDATPIAEFVQKSAELLPVMEELLKTFQRAEGEEVADLVRGGAESLKLRNEWQARKAVPARSNPVSLRQLHAAAVAGTGYLVLTGLDKDHLSAAAYFVREGGKFRFDWEASEGYSELLPSEVDQLNDNEPRLMRVVIEPKIFFTPQFLEKDFRCYAFNHQDEGEFVWAFAKRDSVVDRSLLASYYTQDLAGTDRRATVRVRKGPDGARPNELEVVEFLHTDWLTPD